MDISKLITLGSLDKVLNYAGIKIHLTTPSSDDLKDITTNLDMAVKFITKIDDKEFVSPESKAELKDIFGKMQSVLTGHIIKACVDLV
jgi:hypothetical protein